MQTTIKILSTLFLLTWISNMTLSAQAWKSYYDEVKEVENGQYIVKRFDKYGVVDVEGGAVLQTQYDTILAFPKGYIVEYKDVNYSRNRQIHREVFNRKGTMTFESNNFVGLYPISSDYWKDVSDSIPIWRYATTVIHKETYETILPLRKEIILALGRNDNLFLIAYEEDSYAIMNAQGDLLSDYIYTKKLVQHEDYKDIFKNKTGNPKLYNSNISSWLLKKDTIVFISTLNGKELWKTTEKPKELWYCGNGIHLVKRDGYHADGKFVLIDEVTATIKTLNNVLDIEEYLGNGLFHAISADGRYQKVLLNAQGQILQDSDYDNVKAMENVERPHTEEGVVEMTFNDYYLASKDGYTYLVRKRDERRCKLGQGSLSNKLIPILKTNRYFIFGYAKDEDVYYPITSEYEEIFIVDTERMYLDFTKEVSYNHELRFKLTNSAPEYGVFVFEDYNNSTRDIDGYIVKGSSWQSFTKIERLDKLDYEGTYYKVKRDTWDDAVRDHNATKVVSTETSRTILSGVADAIFFGENEARFLVKKSRDYDDHDFYLADIEGTKIKTITGIDDVGKTDDIAMGTSHVRAGKTFKDERRPYASVYRSVTERYERGSRTYQLEGLMNENGDEVIIPKHKGIEMMGRGGEYAYLFEENVGEGEERKYRLIPIQGMPITLKSNYFRHYVSDACVIFQKSEGRYQIFNWATGQLSPTFDGIDFRTFDEKGYFFTQDGDRMAAYDTETLTKIADYPIEDEWNATIIWNPFTNETHSINHHRGVSVEDDSKYLYLYRLEPEYIDWNGN